MSKTAEKKYRPCVGIALFNKQGEVLVGERKSDYGAYRWQMPQGGIDQGEAPIHAAIREMQEEIGVSINRVKPLGETKGWLRYDFPADMDSRKFRKFRGQKQKWFALRFLGKDKHVDLNSHHQIEFVDWKWAPLAQTPALIVPFKRPVYEQLVDVFEPYTKTVI